MKFNNTDFKSREVGMFRLRDLKNGVYQIHKKDGEAFEGTLKAIFRASVELGVRVPDFELAVNEMTKNGHDYAEFGIFGRFIYSATDRKAA